MNVVVIDGSDDDNGFLKRHRGGAPNALVVADVESMVQGILRRLGAQQSIDRLIIVGHGASGIIGAGDGEGNGSTLRLSGHLLPGEQVGTAARGLQVLGLDRHGQLRGRAVLGRLSGHFAPGAVVELQGCQVGRGHQGRELLRQLADLWRVNVQASIDDQHFDPVLQGSRHAGLRFEGQVIEASRTAGHGARVHAVR